MWNTVITKDPAYVCRTNDAQFFFSPPPFTVVFSLLRTPLAYIWGERRRRDLCVSQAAAPNLKLLHYTLGLTAESLLVRRQRSRLAFTDK